MLKPIKRILSTLSDAIDSLFTPAMGIPNQYVAEQNRLAATQRPGPLSTNEVLAALDHVERHALELQTHLELLALRAKDLRTQAQDTTARLNAAIGTAARRAPHALREQ